MSLMYDPNASDLAKIPDEDDDDEDEEYIEVGDSTLVSRYRRGPAEKQKLKSRLVHNSKN